MSKWCRGANTGKRMFILIASGWYNEGIQLRSTNPTGDNLLIPLNWIRTKPLLTNVTPS